MKTTITKATLTTLITILLCLVFSPILVHAIPHDVATRDTVQLKKFTPLSNLPLLDSWGPGKSYDGSTSEVFNTLFKLSIQVGAMLAVFMFIWGGLKLITARDNPSNVTIGKKKMKNAIFGLLMLLSTFVVLNTINPQLLDIKILGEGTIQLDAPPLKKPMTPYEERVANNHVAVVCEYTKYGKEHADGLPQCFNSMSECVSAVGNHRCRQPNSSTIILSLYKISGGGVKYFANQPLCRKNAIKSLKDAKMPEAIGLEEPVGCENIEYKNKHLGWCANKRNWKYCSRERVRYSALINH